MKALFSTNSHNAAAAAAASAAAAAAAAAANGMYSAPISPKRGDPDRVIGYGAFGVVWSVTDPRTQKRVALKKMPNVSNGGGLLIAIEIADDF